MVCAVEDSPLPIYGDFLDLLVFYNHCSTRIRTENKNYRGTDYRIVQFPDAIISSSSYLPGINSHH